MPKILFVLITCFLFTNFTSAESTAPSRASIEAKMAEMGKYAQANDYPTWASFFAEDATFFNAALTDPVVGRSAIVELAGTWPVAETEIEWRAIDGARVAIGWRERRQLEDGKTSGWYRGISTFLFNAEGEVQAYEGMFNLPSIMSAVSNAK